MVIQNNSCHKTEMYGTSVFGLLSRLLSNLGLLASKLISIKPIQKIYVQSIQ